MCRVRAGEIKAVMMATFLVGGQILSSRHRFRSRALLGVDVVIWPLTGQACM